MIQKSGAGFCRGDPWLRRPGRIMTDMLGVPAFQFGNPVALIVLSKADNPALHKDY